MERFTPRQLLLLCCAIALVVFLLIYFTLTRLTAEKPKPVEVKPPQPTTTTIVLAQKDIAPREIVRGNMLTLKEVPINTVPAGAVHRTTDIIGRPTKVGIVEGEVITTYKLYASVQDAGLSGRIPSNCRAVTVGISDVTGVAGFAQPGDYVDVMLVSGNVEPHKVVSEMILQNVLLLAINKSVDNTSTAPPPQQKDAGKGKQGNQNQAAAGGSNNVKATGTPVTATLALLPEDSLKLAAKAQLGQIYLALRPFRPVVPNSEETYYSVTKASGRLQTAPDGKTPIVGGVDNPTNNIQVIRGTTSTVGR
jgi:pilus assembly protein CpaB